MTSFCFLLPEAEEEVDHAAADGEAEAAGAVTAEEARRIAVEETAAFQRELAQAQASVVEAPVAVETTVVEAPPKDTPPANVKKEGERRKTWAQRYIGG